MLGLPGSPRTPRCLCDKAQARATKHNGAKSADQAQLSEIHLNLGTSFFDCGRVEEASKAFDAALECDPNNAAAKQNANYLRSLA